MATNPARTARAAHAVMRENAERVLADPRQSRRHAAAREILARPEPVAPARQGRRGGRAQDAAVEQLTGLRRDVEAAFDVSPPPDTPNAHKRLAARDGSPKVGGRQRNRAVAVDRYLSHRRGDQVAAIGWVRRHDEDVATGGRWYLFSNDTWSDMGPPPPLSEAEPGPTFEEARAAFLARLEEIGTPWRK